MSERQLATVCTNPFRVDRIIHEWQQGETLADIMASVQPNRTLWAGAHVYLGDIEIKPEYYHVVHPRPDTLVTIKILPHDSDILRSVAFIALAVASAYTGGLAGGIFGGGANLSAGAISGVVSAGVFVGGSLLINALIPLDTPALDDGDNASQALSVGASRNRLNPFGNLTTLLGFHRFAPNFAAAPYTDLDGQDQSVVMLYTVGFKNVEVDINTIRVGNTPLSSFDGVTAEYLTGGSGDNVSSISIYKDLAFEDVLNKQIPGGNREPGYAQASTQPVVDEVQFEIHFPKGLVFYQGDGDITQLAVTVTVEYSASLTGPWSPMDAPGFDANGDYKFVAASQVPIRQSFQWVPPSQGQWHIRMRAKTRNDAGPQIYNERTFAILRSFKYGSPVSDPNISQIALRIQATDQLNGVPDQITMWCQSRMPDYATGSWVDDTITNNPASIARWLLTGKPNARALDPSRLDGQSFIDFWIYCNGRYTFNQVIDFNTTIHETLQRVCRAAFARPVQVDGFWKIIIDEPQTVVRQVFTPRNSWGFSATRSFPELIEGFQVRYINGTTNQDDYANQEQVVYADGFNASNSTGKFESLEAIGITNWDHVWEFGRRYLAIAKLQPEAFTISVDAEHLVTIVGDLVEYQQDAIKVGLGASRVKLIDTTKVTLDAAMPGDGVTSYAIQFRHSAPGNFGSNSVTTVPVITFSGLSDTLTFTTPGTYGEAGDLATFGELDRINLPMLIKNIEPTTDLAARLTLLPYADGIYTAADGTIPAYDPLLTDPPGAGTPVISNIQSDEYVMSRDSAGVLQTRVVVSLAFVENRVAVQGVIGQWRVYSSIPANAVDWVSLGVLPGDTATFIITDINEKAQIEIRTRFLFRDGTSSAWTNYYDSEADTPYHTVIGKTNPPPDYAALQVNVQASGLREYTWAFDPGTLLPPDLDGAQIRYFDVDDLSGTPVEYGLMDGDIYGLMDGDTYALQYTDVLPSWEEMTPLTLGRLYFSPFEYNAPFEGSWFFAIKALDVGNLESVNAFYTGVVPLPAPQLGNSLFYIDHFTNNWFEGQTPGAVPDPGWQVSPTTGYLQGVTTQTWASAVTWAGGGTWQGAPSTLFTFTQEPGLVPFDPAIATGNIRLETTTVMDPLSTATFVFRYAINGGTFTGNEFVSGDIVINPGGGGFTSLEFQMEVTNAPAEGVRNWIVEGYASA